MSTSARLAVAAAAGSVSDPTNHYGGAHRRLKEPRWTIKWAIIRSPRILSNDPEMLSHSGGSPATIGHGILRDVTVRCVQPVASANAANAVRSRMPWGMTSRTIVMTIALYGARKHADPKHA